MESFVTIVNGFVCRGPNYACLVIFTKKDHCRSEASIIFIKFSPFYIHFYCFLLIFSRLVEKGDAIEKKKNEIVQLTSKLQKVSKIEFII